MKNKTAKQANRLSLQEISFLKLNVQGAELPAAILESISDGFVAVNEKWEYIYVNQKAAFFFNSTPAALLGTHIWDIYTPEKATAFRSACERVMKYRQPEVIVHYCDVLKRYFEHRIYPVSKGISIFYKDNTEKEKALIALEQSEKKWKALVENSPDIILQIDRNRRILYASPAISNMMGYDLKEVTGMQIDQLVFEGDLVPVLEILEPMAHGDEQLQNITYRIKRKDGTLMHMEAVFTNLLQQQGVNAIIINQRDVTQRLLEQQKETEQRQRLQTILNNEPECVKLLSVEGLLLDINPAGLEMLEASGIEEVQGKKVLSFIYPQDVDAVQLSHRRVCEGHKEKLQFRMKNKSGRILWMDSSMAPLKNEEGKVYAVLSVTRDITAAKAAETALLNGRHQLQRALSDLQKIMDSSLDVICTLNENGIFMQVSAACQKAWGYNPAEMAGRRGIGFVSKEERSHTIAVINEIKNTLRESMFETSIVSKNGRVIPVICSAKWDANEKIMYAIARDNTERRQTEEALRISKERYHQLFYTNPLPLWLFDIENLQFLEVNEAALKKYEYSRKQFLQLGMKDIMLPTEAALFNHEIVESSFQNGDDFSMSARHVKKTGEIIFVDMKWHRMLLNGRRMVMCLVVDVTEKVNLENRLLKEKVNRQIEITKVTIQAQEAERNEIGRELHDNVNQILTTARLYIDQAQTDMANREVFLGASKNFVMKAIEEIRRLSRSLVAHTVADLGIVDSITDLIETIMMVQKIQIVLHHDAFDERLIDENMKLTLYRIVQEQLNNIIKHAQACKVVIVLQQKPGELSLSVSDNGVGFDTSAKRKGVGITNIINRAELYNGIVTLDSTPGAGCLLTVDFPS